MKPLDVAIWERYIAQNPDAYKTVQYDVPVGSTPDFDTTVNPETGGDNAFNYRRKIDVVGHTDEHIDIIEIKPRAGSGALGQVRSYKSLYERDYGPKKNVRAVVITDERTPDIDMLAAELNVKIIIV